MREIVRFRSLAGQSVHLYSYLQNSKMLNLCLKKTNQGSHNILCYIFTVYNGRACHLVFLARFWLVSAQGENPDQFPEGKKKVVLNNVFVICRLILSREKKIDLNHIFLWKKSGIFFSQVKSPSTKMNFNLISTCICLSYYCLIKTTQLQFGWNYLDGTIKKHEV